MLRVETPVLPPVDQTRERPRRPSFLVQILGLQDLLEQPQLVVRIEDGEIRPEADKLGMHAQDLGADRMEGAEPRHRLFGAGERRHPLTHLAGGLVGERDRQNFVRASPPRGDQICDARGQDAGLADARAGENENRPVQRLDGPALLFVQPFEEGRMDGVRASRRRPLVSGLGVYRPAGRNHGIKTIRIALHLRNHALASRTTQPWLSNV